MRNVFDQYSQPENRVTHALFASLNEDRRLLASFLYEVAKIRRPPNKHDLTIVEQSYPAGPSLAEEDAERRGVPDVWVFDAENWCLIVESKVLAQVNADQITRHIGTAKKHGFSQIDVLVLTVRKPKTILSPETRIVEWREVYSWLRQQRHDREWAIRAADYFEVAETRMIAAAQLGEGTLTKFAGFPFGVNKPFDYLEAKRIMRLALSELRTRSDLKSILNIDPRLPGRPAITGKDQDSVWDFLQLAAAQGARTFTSFPHFTLSVTHHGLEAMLTIPNSVGTTFRKNLIALELSGFRELLTEVLKRMKPVLKLELNARPWMGGVQRRYLTQRSSPFIDAEIQFDIRTAFDGAKPVKQQPQWLASAYDAFTNKTSNFQIQVGMKFDYRHCAIVHTEKALDAIASAWIACAPIVDLAT